MKKNKNKFGKLSATFVFFIIFLTGTLSHKVITTDILIATLLKAFVGALIFWLIGIIISDIAIKGMIENLDLDDKNIWSGGLLTRVAQEKEKMLKDQESEKIDEITLDEKNTTKEN